MMHGHEKSDSAIVAVKPANKVERSAAEPVEPRAETKGNVGQQSTRRTQSRISVSQLQAAYGISLPLMPEAATIAKRFSAVARTRHANALRQRRVTEI